jgi:peptide deformylase
MSKLKIFSFPDLVLAQKALPVPRVDKALRVIADDMLETMYDAPGIGLAANQVGLLHKMVVIDVEYEVEDETLGVEHFLHKKPRILFNPEIIYKEGRTRFKEACLSVPEFSAEIQRAEKIKVRYQNIDGLEEVLSADGLLAVCIQHELDHLDGKLFIDRLKPIKKTLVKKRLLKEREERESER